MRECWYLVWSSYKNVGYMTGNKKNVSHPLTGKLLSLLQIAYSDIYIPPVTTKRPLHISLDATGRPFDTLSQFLYHTLIVCMQTNSLFIVCFFDALHATKALCMSGIHIYSAGNRSGLSGIRRNKVLLRTSMCLALHPVVAYLVSKGNVFVKSFPNFWI